MPKISFSESAGASSDKLSQGNHGKISTALDVRWRVDFPDRTQANY